MGWWASEQKVGVELSGLEWMDGYAWDWYDYKNTYRAKNDAPNIAALLPYKIGCGRLKGKADIISLP